MPMAQPTKFDRSKSEHSADEIARVLESDGIVLLPTETVYGAFVRSGSQRARDRLFALKGRPTTRGVAEYVSDVEDAERRFGPLPAQAIRLAEAYWPGPLTLVVRTDPSLGLRCPRHPIFPEVLARVPEGVVGTSANLSGEPAPKSIQQIPTTFLDEVDFALADEAAVTGRASTVIGLDPRDSEVPPSLRPVEWLRPGDLTPEELAPLLHPRLTFVCTGNTCRSPMARAIASELWPVELLGTVDFRSCGLSCAEGEPASEGALAAARKFGWDLSDHHSQPALRAGLLGSDVILVMTESHRRHILSVLPRLAPRIIVLGGADGIPDPFGGSPEVYEDCARSLKRSLSRLIKEWVP